LAQTHGSLPHFMLHRNIETDRSPAAADRKPVHQATAFADSSIAVSYPFHVAY
jgi:hypothetical protein